MNSPNTSRTQNISEQTHVRNMGAKQCTWALHLQVTTRMAWVAIHFVGNEHTSHTENMQSLWMVKHRHSLMRADCCIIRRTKPRWNDTTMWLSNLKGLSSWLDAATRDYIHSSVAGWRNLTTSDENQRYRYRIYRKNTGSFKKLEWLWQHPWYDPGLAFPPSCHHR